MVSARGAPSSSDYRRASPSSGRPRASWRPWVRPYAGPPLAAMAAPLPSLRALLFVPGDAEARFAKAEAAGADGVIFDLEDAVAPEAKAAARALVADALGRPSAGVARIVRVNAPATGLLEDDVRAVVRPGLDALMVPKVEDPATLANVAERVAAVGRGAVPGLIGLVESPTGVAACEQIAARAPASTCTLAFGGVDFCAELGIDPDPAGEGLLHARARVALAARAGALRPALDGPLLALDDDALLAEDSRRSRRLGFGGRLVIHPRQVGPVLEAYGAGGEEDLRRARAIVDAFEAAQREGRATAVVDGAFVDPPVYRRAVEQLAAAGAPVSPGAAADRRGGRPPSPR